MTISLVGSDAVASALGSAAVQTVTFPAGVADGDYAILSAQYFNGTDRGLPTGGVAGWALIANTGGGSWAYRTVVYGRALSASDASTDITVTMSGTTGWTLRVEVFRGIDTADPVNAVSAHRTAVGSSTVTFAPVVTDAADTVLAALFACKDPVTQGGGFAPPAGFTESTDTSGGINQYRNGASAYKLQAAAGSVTPGNSTLGRTSDWASFTVALNSGTSTPPVVVDPSGFTPIVTDPATGLDFRPGPSAEHLAMLAEGTGGQWVMAIDIIDAATFEPIYSTVAGPSDEAQPWAAEPDGPLRFSRGRAAQRSMSFTVPLDDEAGALSALMPRGSGHPAHPVTRNLIRVWAGHRFADRDELIPVLTNVVDDAVAVDAQGVRILQLATVDASTLYDVSFGPGGYRIDAGANIVDTVLAVLENKLPDTAIITAEITEFTLPAVELDEGDNVAEFVDQALSAAGMEITTDELGRYHIGHIPATWAPSIDPAEWIYGDDGIPVERVQVRFAVPDTPSGLTLEGASLADDDSAITVSVYDADPDSMTYWDSSTPAPWAFVEEVSNPHVSTDAQGKVAAWAQYRRRGQGGQVVTYYAPPNPALRPDQTVEFGFDRLDVAPGLWKVQDVELPITVGNLMAVTVARSWDPAQEDAEIGDREPPGAGITTASDTFDFGAGDNGYLYNYPNWKTQGNDTVYPRANKVLGGGYLYGGMGRWTTPAASTNHWAQLDIVELESHSKGIGPHVRCDTTGPTIVGYSASVVWAGGATNRIELRRWDTKKSYAVIGTYTHPATLEGTTVRIEASDEALTVKVDAVVVLETDDSRHTAGTWFGFVISGAWGDNWSAGTL